MGHAGLHGFLQVREPQDEGKCWPNDKSGRQSNDRTWQRLRAFLALTFTGKAYSQASHVSELSH